MAPTFVSGQARRASEARAKEARAARVAVRVSGSAGVIDDDDGAAAAARQRAVEDSLRMYAEQKAARRKA